MKLNNARVCMDCEEVFETDLNCPACGSSVWFVLGNTVLFDQNRMAEERVAQGGNPPRFGHPHRNNS